MLVTGVASCKDKQPEQREPAIRARSPSEAVTAPPDGSRTSLPERGPHPDYPTPVSAGTDKLFVLEEPDRGPPAPAGFTLPPRGTLTWTTAPHCELDAIRATCSAGAAHGLWSWRIGRGRDVTVVEHLRAGSVDETTVYEASADGQLRRRIRLDAHRQLDHALLVTTPGRFSGRQRDGSNALRGCGMLAYKLAKDQLGELACLQWLGEPMRDTKGIARRTFARDPRGFVIEEQRFGLDGAPAAAVDGAQRVTYERDAIGRVVVERYRDARGEPVVTTSGCAGYRSEFDEAGTEIRRTCLGADDRPAPDDEGVTVTQSATDARGCQVGTRYLGAGGEPVADRGGLHGARYEVNGACETTRHTCLGGEDLPTPCGPGQPATYVYKRDARGQITSATHYAADGTRSADVGFEVFELRYTFDDVGHQLSEACFAPGGVAVDCGTTGFHEMRSTFDDAGRQITRTFRDTAGLPGTNVDISTIKTRYDNYDHVTETRNYDAEGEVRISQGAAIRRDLWDATHRSFGVLMLDRDGHPAAYGGCYTGATCPTVPWHAVRIRRRPTGTVEANQFFDVDGQLIKTIDCRTAPCFE